MTSGAVFSDCRTWRYALLRTWDNERPPLVVIGLNPSTADETLDDPTIRRCIGFARAWGMGGLTMLNLFAFRATKPAAMKAAADPIGPANDSSLLHLTANVPIVLCAWGVHGAFMERGPRVAGTLLAHLRPLYYLAMTKGGCPKHPLYLRADLTPTRWT